MTGKRRRSRSEKGKDESEKTEHVIIGDPDFKKEMKKDRFKGNRSEEGVSFLPAGRRSDDRF
jgi:hypothetical protein